MTIYVTAAVFLLSLQSFYFAAAGGSILCYLGLLMLLPLAVGRPVSVAALALTAAFYALIAIRGVIDPASIDKGLIGTLLGLLGLVAIPGAFARREQVLARALRWVLLIHATVIAFQAAAFFGGLGYIDPLKPFGLAQTVLSQKGIIFGSIRVPRFAGLFNEPGSYSAVIMAMLAAEYALSRRISRVTVFVLASVAATVSLGGMVLASAFLGAVAFGKLLRGEVSAGRGLGLGAALGLFLIYLKTNFEKRARLYMETGMQQDAILAWGLSPRNLTLFGVRVADTPIYFNLGYVGIWLDVLVTYGLLGLLALLAFVAVAIDLSGAALAAVVLLAKLKFTYPLFFVLLGAIYLGRARVAAAAPAGAVAWAR